MRASIDIQPLQDFLAGSTPVNHMTEVSQRALASKFSCDQSYICRLIKKLKITYRLRMKVPKYKDVDAKREAQKRCKILNQKFRTLDLVIDEEKYFGLSEFQMSANRGYYTSDFSRTRMAVKTYAKKKFDPKVMLWIAMSPKGMSIPVLTSGKVLLSPTFLYRQPFGTPPGTLPGHPLPPQRLHLLARQG